MTKDKMEFTSGDVEVVHIRTLKTNFLRALATSKSDIIPKGPDEEEQDSAPRQDLANKSAKTMDKVPSCRALSGTLSGRIIANRPVCTLRTMSDI